MREYTGHLRARHACALRLHSLVHAPVSRSGHELKIVTADNPGILFIYATSKLSCVLQDPHLVELGVEYVSLDKLIEESQIITLNCPLLDSTYHMINDSSISRMRDGVMIVNTGRGKLIDTAALVRGLKSGKVGSVALDVYEEEDRLFFEDRSSQIIADDTFSRLLTFPNVLMTAHQAFLTEEALEAIARTTLANVAEVLADKECANQIN